MDNTGFDILIMAFEQVDVILLIFVRVFGFFMLVPVISGQNIFISARIFLALTMSIALFMSGAVTMVHVLDSTLGYVYLLLIEFLVGMTIAYAAFAVFNLIFFAGQLIDFQIGLAMVNVLDPMTQIQVPIVGNLFYFALLAVTVVTGGLHAMFATFFYSFGVLPVGTGQILGNPEITYYILFLLVESTILGVRLAMPIIGVMLVVDAALGIMVKTVPQMNIFVVGMPLKVLVGLILLYLVLVPSLGVMHASIFDMAINAMREVIWGLRGTT